VTERKGGSGAFWLVGVVLLVTAAGLFYSYWRRREPTRVTVKHILISFKGTMTTATRSQKDAERLATETFNRIRGQVDFDMLMQALSDDPAGLAYTLCNKGVTPDPGEFTRGIWSLRSAISASRSRLAKSGSLPTTPSPARSAGTSSSG
jgi:hypothetical protein